MTEYNAEASEPREPEHVTALPYTGYEFSLLTPEGITHNEARLLATARMWQETATQRGLIIRDMDDDRLTAVWEKASDIANEKGYCSVFDEVLEAIGTSWRRSRDYEHEVTVTYTVTVFSSGSDLQDAIENIDEYNVFQAVRDQVYYLS